MAQTWDDTWDFLIKNRSEACLNQKPTESENRALVKQVQGSLKKKVKLEKRVQKLMKLAEPWCVGLVKIYQNQVDSEGKNYYYLRNLFIERNFPLIFSLAKRFVSKDVSIGDLLSAGCVGMIRGLEKIDLKRKNKVSTYLSWWIVNGIRNAVWHRTLIRIPKTLRDGDVLGHESAERVRQGWVSVEAEQLSFEDYREGVEETDNLEELELMRAAIERIPERERRFLKRRLEGVTLEVMGEEMGLTKERVRQILVRAERFLRRELKREIPETLVVG